MNLTRTNTRVQIQQVQKPQVPYFTYEPARRFISKINNLHFASSRALILSLLIALVALSTGQLAHNTSKLSFLFDTVLSTVILHLDFVQQITLSNTKTK